MKLFRAYWVHNNHPDVTNRLDLECAEPATALRHAHRRIQVERKVKPDDYRLTRLAHAYLANGHNIKDGIIESNFDIPAGPNVDLRKSPAKQTQSNDEMPFMSNPELLMTPAGDKGWWS